MRTIEILTAYVLEAYLHQNLETMFLILKLKSLTINETNVLTDIDFKISKNIFRTKRRGRWSYNQAFTVASFV